MRGNRNPHLPSQPPPRQRRQEAEKEQRIAKEKEEGGPDPRIVEMDVLKTQVAPRGMYARRDDLPGVSKTIGMRQRAHFNVFPPLNMRRPR